MDELDEQFSPEPMSIVAVVVGGPYDGRLVELGDHGFTVAPAQLQLQDAGKNPATYRFECAIDDEHHLYVVEPA